MAISDVETLTDGLLSKKAEFSWILSQNGEARF